MKKIFLLFNLSCLLLPSCISTGVNTNVSASYDVCLNAVESPADAKKNYGETKIVLSEDEDISKYRYEDDYISITWFVLRSQFEFKLENKSNHSIKINWDDVSYVDINGKVGRVMHAGIKYSEKNNSQPPITIPKGASIEDILVPTDNVEYESYIGWYTKPLINATFSSIEEKKVLGVKNIGKEMRILFPLVIENVQNDYVYTFKVEQMR